MRDLCCYWLISKPEIFERSILPHLVITSSTFTHVSVLSFFVDVVQVPRVPIISEDPPEISWHDVPVDAAISVHCVDGSRGLRACSSSLHRCALDLRPGLRPAKCDLEPETCDQLRPPTCNLWCPGPWRHVCQARRWFDGNCDMQC